MVSFTVVAIANKHLFSYKVPYAVSQVTYAIQEGFYSRRFLIGTIFHPVIEFFEYDLRVLYHISFLGFAALTITVLCGLKYVSVNDRFLFAFALLFIPGSVFFLNIGFMEGWGYFFTAIASWLASKGKLNFLLLSFLFLAFSYAASDHSLLFGSIIYLYFASKRWGYVRIFPAFFVISAFFAYLLVFTSVSLESVERLMKKINDKGTELPIEGFRYLTTGLYHLIPINGRGEVFTDPGVSRVGQTAIWAVVFSLVLSIMFAIKRSGFIDYIYGVLFVWAPFPLSIVAYDWNRWQSMIFLNFFLAYVIAQRGITGRAVIINRALFLLAVVFISFFTSNYSFFNIEVYRVVGLLR
ncbi:MAG: hypothetical protein ACKOW9_00130 [Candidatus Paceibacterota bacterium]